MSSNTLITDALSSAANHASRTVAAAGLVGCTLGGGVFLLAYEQGGFPVTTRNAAAIATMWALALAALVVPSAYRALRGLALVPPLALGALGVLSLASMHWGASGERAMDAFDLYSLYGGVFVLTLIVVRRRHLAAWRDGLAFGLAAVAVLGLTSRLAPQIVDVGHAFDFLPVGYIRLSYPVGYWNGLGLLIALAVPLLLHSATDRRRLVVRAAAILPLPALAATAYLTSSRGGALSALVGIVVFVLLSPARWRVVGATLVAGGGSVLAVRTLLHRPELVNGPLDSSAAAAQRGGAAAGILLACVASAIVYAALAALLPRLPRRVVVSERVPVLLTVLALVAVAVAVHPIRLFDNFRSGSAPGSGGAGYVQAHLLSSSANGRWQLWTAAVKEFRAHPLLGGGAGSYSEWWLQHRPYAGFVQDAHSFYLQLLAELGIVGFALGVLILAAAFVGVVRLVRGGDGPLRADAAAFAAVFFAFAFGVGFDWTWQIPAVTLPALVALAMLMRITQRRASKVPGPLRPEVTVAASVAALVLLGGLIWAQAAPLAAQRKIESSYAAATRGDAQAAYDAALGARSLEPWATTPYLQLALLDESSGKLTPARRWIAQAIERDPRNWQLWVVAARLSAKADAIPAARRQLALATTLNPLALRGTSFR